MCKRETLKELQEREIPTPTERHWYQRGYDDAKAEAMSGNPWWEGGLPRMPVEGKEG